MKLMPGRRIGYVGYKTPEVAAKSVAYFNKTYIRLSRIAVEPAKSVRVIYFRLQVLETQANRTRAD